MSDAKIPGGYILLSKKIIESSIWEKPPLYIKVWVWLLCRAQYRDFKGLKRGQLWISIPMIQDAMTYKIGFRTIRPTIKEIRSVLDFLRFPDEGRNKGTMKGAMMDTMKGTHGMLANISNYDLYQLPENYEGHNEGHDEGHNENPTKGTTGAQYKQRNINKYNSSKVFDENDISYTFAKKLLEMILENKPDAKQPDLQKWAKDIDMMIRIDKREPDRILKVIEFSQKDPFWRTNILSTAKLRKQFDQLEMKMTDKPKQSGLGWL